MTSRPREIPPIAQTAARPTRRTVALALGVLALATGAGLLGGCASAPPAETLSFLDERTGITLSVVDEPLVLARDRRDLAANARDYLTLVAVTRNQSGRITPALLLYRWSTIDSRVAAPLADVPKEFSPSAVHDLWRPPVSTVSTTAYKIDAATLLFIAQSGHVSAFIDQPGDGLPYSLWRDGRAALERFATVTR